MFWTLDCDGQQIHVFVQTVLLHSGTLAESTNESQLRASDTILAYVQDNCPVRLLHDQCYTNNWIPQKREWSVDKNARHGVHCMHASNKTAT